MLKEFKTFILRGNVLDLAVAVIMGSTFGAIVNSLVKDVIMPPIGLILGKINFSDLFISLSGESFKSLKAAQDAGAPTLNYGLFIQSVINFLIVSFAIFLLIQAANKLQKPLKMAIEPATPTTPTTKDCPFCFSNIHIKATRCPNCTSEIKSE